MVLIIITYLVFVICSNFKAIANRILLIAYWSLHIVYPNAILFFFDQR